MATEKIAIVSRHEATIKKLLEMYPEATVFKSSVVADDLKGFVKVIGNLPFAIAAEICNIGIEFYSVEWETFPPRGVELKKEDFKKYGFKLTRYEVLRKGV